MKNRKEIAENVLVYMEDYLISSGWKDCELGLLRIDPITKCKHTGPTAWSIQIERDLASNLSDDDAYEIIDKL